MSMLIRHILARILFFLIALSGAATLSWEVIWQIKSTLALGASAWGTAITLIVTMGGMSIGGFLMGKALCEHRRVSPLYLYGLLEIIIGVCGLFLNRAFDLLTQLDGWAYGWMPQSISLIFILGIIIVCGIPTLCMGATFPVFGLIAQQYSFSLTKIYRFNILGGALGVLMVAFIMIPMLGVTATLWVIAGINILIGLVVFFYPYLCHSREDGNLFGMDSRLRGNDTVNDTFYIKIFIVFVTGFATFTLEIAWFRSLLSEFANSTDVFAILLACMLFALSLAAKNVQKLKNQKKSLGTQLCIAGILILLCTPLIERIDDIFIFYKHNVTHASTTLEPMITQWLAHPNSFNHIVVMNYIFHLVLSFCWAYFIIVPSMRFLGVAFPWILEEERSSRSIGTLYAVNTLAAVIGSISAAWFFLPLIGFAKTAWMAGLLVASAGIFILPQPKRVLACVLSLSALFIAIYFETGIGKTHVQSYFATDEKGNYAHVLDFVEGPDATISALQYEDGSRSLLINSTEAAIEFTPSAHYMAWMGHLPMLLHPNPKKALVICFGTGQTSNSIRRENPQQLDIVDINANVFKLGHDFRSNENVLNDPRVHKIVMDGRAYLRRTKTHYDVITLEPMPPGTVGVNALYSLEFYQQARAKLTSEGVIAQWLPFHCVEPHYTTSIAKTFIQVFPNAVLWLDPVSHTGILLGTKNNSVPLATSWPGFLRSITLRNLSNEQIQKYVVLNAAELERYSQTGEIITDDNQLLSYGKALYISDLVDLNFAWLQRINPDISKLIK